MSDFLHFTYDLNDPGIASAFDQVSFWSARFGSFLFSHLPLRPNLNILDLACGTGFPLLELAQVYGASCQVMGIDMTNSTSSPSSKTSSIRWQAFMGNCE